MKHNSQFVSPVKRLAASIYDFFLLLGVWFACGSIALWLNNFKAFDPSNVEEVHPAIGMGILFISSWVFYSFFWIKGGTLGMAAWNITIQSAQGGNVTLKQATIRFIVNIIILLTFGLLLLQIYFSKDRKAINDQLSGTKLNLS
jgi:uncharacterized RDD family membrane protein YckC